MNKKTSTQTPDNKALVGNAILQICLIYTTDAADDP